METPITNQDTATKPPEPLCTFEREYFIQTRKEIDTEKQERNKILNYAILAVGGISLALSRVGEPLLFLRSPAALCLYVPLLFLISVLLVARRAKLRQIGDRWFVLESMLRVRAWPKDWTPLECVVCRGLRGRRYLSEDFWVLLGLCIAPYLLIIWVATNLPVRWALPLFLLVLAHAVIGSILLCRPVSPPGLEHHT
jgi:hypothetical protein